jgi:hypothetical protein
MLTPTDLCSRAWCVRKVVLTCADSDYVQSEIPNIVIEAGSRMRSGKPRGPMPKIDVLVPPLSVPFEEAVSRLLK